MKNIEIGKVYMMGFSSCGATPCFVLKKIGEGIYWVSIPNSIAPIVVNGDLLFEAEAEAEEEPKPVSRKVYKVLTKYWSATIYAWCTNNLKEYWSVNDTTNIFTFHSFDEMMMFVKKWPNDIINIIFETDYAKSK